MVRRILLGSQLRRLRESRGITREAAGYSIRASESKISRMELGRVSFKARDVEDLLTLYGVTDEAERESLLGLAREANVAGWWHSYGDVLPGWFQTYVGLEGAASYIRIYEVQFVHGLLQTEAYAHAVVARGTPRAPRPRSTAGWRCAWSGRRCWSPRAPPRSTSCWTRPRCAVRTATASDARTTAATSSRSPNSRTSRCRSCRSSFGGHAGRERCLHAAPFPRVRPVRHRLSRAADERAVPGQARRGGPVRAGDEGTPDSAAPSGPGSRNVLHGLLQLTLMRTYDDVPSVDYPQ